MTLDIRRWGAGHLVGSWAAYWAGLAVVRLSPIALTIWKISHGPGEHGTLSVALSNDGFVLDVVKSGATVFTATAPLVSTALWIAVPPLAIWVAWLAMRPSRGDREVLEAVAKLQTLPDARRDSWGSRSARVLTPIPVDRRENRG